MKKEEFVELIRIDEPPFGVDVLARMFHVPVCLVEEALLMHERGEEMNRTAAMVPHNAKER